MLNFTQEERRVILFLLTIALAGTGINFLAKRNSTVKTIIYQDPDICKVNLNTAQVSQLISVPGIGEKLAERIIDYRQKQTNFSEIEELKNIRGINENKYQKLKDCFTLE